MKRLRPHFLALLFSAVSLASNVHAEKRQDGEDSRDDETRAEAPDRPDDMPLAELPERPATDLPPPRPRALEAIDRLLQEIVSSDPLVRQRAQRSLLEAKKDWVSGVSRRIDKVAERVDRNAIDHVLDKARDKYREHHRGEDEETSDYLEVVLQSPDPDSAAWRDLTQILALNRMLTAIGTTEAVREIIRIYVRFGEALRIDCQRQLDELGDRSIAGLIEALRHPAPAIQKWADLRLTLRKKLSPHEAVRTEDRVALADILVALGRHGDPESTRLLISFAGTERSEIRKAARQGIVLLGEAAAWQLRDAYLDTTGKTPPRDWTWKRTARELFTEFDRLRLERLYKLFAEAKKAEAAENWEEMRAGYDKILTLQPGFDQRSDMVEGYRRYAKHVVHDKPKEALLALRRAERIDDDEASRRRTESARLLLEAELLRKQGIIDQDLLRRAKHLDQTRSDEAERLATPGSGVTTWGRKSRYFVAGAVSLIALLGSGWIFLVTLRRRGGEQPQSKQQPSPETSPDGDSANEESAPNPDPTAEETADKDTANEDDEDRSTGVPS